VALWSSAVILSSQNQDSHVFALEVADNEAGQRLDVFLANRFPNYSRVFLRRAINAAQVTVDGSRTKAAWRLRPGQKIHVSLTEIPREGPQPEDIPLDVLYEDDHLVAVNKPSGMVVHPAKGHWQGTLAGALAFHFSQLSQVGGATRPGIVHRLDRETSGVLVVAKNDAAHLALAKQFEQRDVEKQYFAIVQGVPDRDRDVIQRTIGVHPYQREKMCIREGHATSRDASTFYEVAHRFGRFTTVNVFPKTGRTHQIRVHLSSIGTPVLCDRLYGGRSRVTLGELVPNHTVVQDPDQIALDRLALHAFKLRLRHPCDDRWLEFSADLPDELSRIVRYLHGDLEG